MNRLNKKVSIVTGAGSGLGREAALLFAKEGAHVVVVDIDGEKCESVVKEIIEAGGSAISVPTDITKDADCDNMVKVAVDTWGTVDVLYCNAGITGSLAYDTCHIVESDFDKIVDINIKGTWKTMKSTLPTMVKNGGGSVVCTASVAGMLGAAGGTAYCGSKAFVISMCQTAAYEFAMHNIRVNSVSPFTMETPLMTFMLSGENGDEMRKLFGQDNMAHRLIEPVEVATAALFLASDEASGITGQNIVIDQGMTAKGFSFIESEHKQNNPY